MNIKIYQINNERDSDRAMFMGLDFLERHTGNRNVDSSIYDVAYVGSAAGKSLEDVYHQFNMNRPPEFTGHSLSVSDVVEVVDSPMLVGVIDRADNLKIPYTDFIEYTLAQEFCRENNIEFEAHDYVGLSVPSVEPGFYFCDSFGFKKIDFEPEKTQEKDVRKIKVVMVEPEKEARVVELEDDLAAMQHAVGGFIQTMYPFEDEVAIVCNEEGKLIGLPLNRAVYMDSEMVDIMAGNFFICATPADSENFESLSDEQAKRYLEMYKDPEKFYRVGGKITAVKVKPSVDKQIASAQKQTKKPAEVIKNNEQEL